MTDMKSAESKQLPISMLDFRINQLFLLRLKTKAIQEQDGVLLQQVDALIAREKELYQEKIDLALTKENISALWQKLTEDAEADRKRVAKIEILREDIDWTNDKITQTVGQEMTAWKVVRRNKEYQLKKFQEENAAFITNSDFLTAKNQEVQQVYETVWQACAASIRELNRSFSQLLEKETSDWFDDGELAAIPITVATEEATVTRQEMLQEVDEKRTIKISQVIYTTEEEKADIEPEEIEEPEPMRPRKKRRGGRKNGR